MDFSRLVEQRRSCRKYLPSPVEREKLQRCLQAARLSPSACNAQPWRFIVLDEKDARENLAEAACSGIYRMSKFIKSAPVIIAVCADVKSFASKAGSFVRGTNFYLIDIGIACQNLVLQSTEDGLGTCYIGWFNERKVKKALGLGKKIKIPLLISMGYPEDRHTEKDPIRRRAGGDKRKPIEEIVSYNPPAEDF